MNRLGAASLFVLGLLAPRMAAAQTHTVEAKYHGVLSIRTATGTIDRDSGSGTIKVKRWTVLLSPDTNGIFPDQEPVMVSVRSNEDNFILPAGAFKASKSRRVFSYRVTSGGPARGLRKFRVVLRNDGPFKSYRISFVLDGLEMSLLRNEDPVCIPIAVIIGDDDFFSGVNLTSPSFFSRRVRTAVPSSCNVSDDDWPWIRG